MTDSKTTDIKAKVEEATAEVKAKVEETTTEIKAKVEEATADVRAKVEEATAEVKAKAEEVKAQSTEAVEKLQEQVKDVQEQGTDLAQKAFRANLGLYVKAFEQGQELVSEYNTKAISLFEELVARGEKVEADAKANIESQQKNVEDKLAPVLERLESLKSSFSKKDTEATTA